MTSTNSPAANAAPAKSGILRWIVVVALVFIVGIWTMNARNNLANLRQDVLEQFGQVQNVMQRRTDVLINVANVASAAAKNERGALTDIAAARSSAIAMNEFLKKLDPAKLAEDKDLQKQFFDAATAQQQSLVKLNSIVEAYPEIKATGLYTRLQDEVSGSENRVAVERMRSQQKIRDYNAAAVIFPANIIAKVFGYPEMAYYQASETSQQAPDLGAVLKQ